MVIVALLGGMYAVMAHRNAGVTPIRRGEGVASTTATGRDDRATYRNDEYGFEMRYPKKLTTDPKFQSYYHLPDTWMSEAGPESKGRPIVSIPVWRIKSDNNGAYISYPYYFDAELRIGVSSNKSDVADCYKSQFTPPTTVTINGVEFKKFSVQSAGMMQYLVAESYRTIHNGACYVIEQIKTGSSYREGPSSKDIPESVLDGYYDSISTMVQTFKFIK